MGKNDCHCPTDIRLEISPQAILGYFGGVILAASGASVNISLIGRRSSVFDAVPEPISSPTRRGETMKRVIVRTLPPVAPGV
jgi:hypothetical protein